MPVGVRATLSTWMPCVGAARQHDTAGRQSRRACRPRRAAPRSARSRRTPECPPASRRRTRRRLRRAARARARPRARCGIAWPISPASARRITIAPGSTATVQRSSARWRANTAGANGWCSTSVPPVSSHGTIVLARPANEASASAPSITASGSMRASRCTASPPAISSAWLRATGTMPSAVMSKVTQRDVIGGLAIALDRRRLAAAREDVVDRHDAVRQVLAEAAQEADGEGLHRDVHREVAMHGVADALAADQRARRHAAERSSSIRMAPEQRQAARRSARRASPRAARSRSRPCWEAGSPPRSRSAGRSRATARRAPRSRGRPARR